jgi:hypothetical protein
LKTNTNARIASEQGGIQNSTNLVASLPARKFNSACDMAWFFCAGSNSYIMAVVLATCYCNEARERKVRAARYNTLIWFGKEKERSTYLDNRFKEKIVEKTIRPHNHKVTVDKAMSEHEQYCDWLHNFEEKKKEHRLRNAAQTKSPARQSRAN